jgi:hypothetical protein
MGGVAVGEDHLIDRPRTHECGQFGLGDDRDTVWIALTGALGWIRTTADARNSRRRESDHLAIGSVAIEHVEVVKISPGCA